MGELQFSRGNGSIASIPMNYFYFLALHDVKSRRFFVIGRTTVLQYKKFNLKLHLNYLHYVETSWVFQI